jgi:membrane peptidoglycan carboxypeptidase
VRVLGGLGRLTIATLLAGVLVAGLLLPYSLGLGLASNRITNALASTPANSLDGPMPERSTITDSSGAPIAYIYNQNRVVVPLSSISENLKVAIKTVEDKRFNFHKGVDWRGTVRALLSNAQDSGGQQGGSTITQQYVKNYLFLVQAKTDAERTAAIATTPGRKLREAKLALTLEQHKTKDDILEGYLNLVAFLPNTYGAEAAAQRLFGKSAADLTVPEAALMAGMVNNPNKYNPLDPDHVTDAKKRRDLVLKLLWQAGSITEAQYKSAIAQGLGTDTGVRMASGCLPAQNSTVNGYFCQYALDYLANAGLSQTDIANGGYTITTTLDPAKMKAAHDAVVAQVNPTANKRIANVLAVVEKGTQRKVLALTANRPYGLDAAKGQTVQKLTTTFAPLGAGSTFKIFTAAAAMQAGLGTDAVIQTPAEYKSPLSAHTFHNDTDNGETFPPTMTLQQALATSPNTGFVKLEDGLGLGKVVDMAVAMGMKGYTLDAGEVDQAFTGSGNTYQQELVTQKVVSFTLGVTPVSPLELANVGATLATDGLWCPPTPINTVQDRANNVVALKQPASCAQAVSPAIARTLTVAMSADIVDRTGTAHQSAVNAGWDLTPQTSAGKTGTTGDYKSSAFLGITAKYSGATVTWDYLPRPQPICMVPPNAPAAAKPLSLAGTCKIAEAKSSEGSKTSKKTGMTGGSVPAATWFTAMKAIQPTPTLFAPADSAAQTGQPNTHVPDLSNLAIDQAKAKVLAAGFTGNFRIETNPTSVPVNVVTRQDPLPNQSALPGTPIDVWYSAGAGTPGG